MNILGLSHCYLKIIMQIHFIRKYSLPPRGLIRRCGYGEIFDRRSGQTSYARRLSGGLYPRFHAYLEEKADGFQINLHLDQKQPSYDKQTAHSGEYEGEVVEREAERIKLIIETNKIIKNI